MILTTGVSFEDFKEIYDAISNVVDYEPTREHIQKIWDALPQDIKNIDFNWGDNSVFRWHLTKWISENIDIVNNLK